MVLAVTLGACAEAPEGPAAPEGPTALVVSEPVERRGPPVERRGAPAPGDQTIAAIATEASDLDVGPADDPDGYGLLLQALTYTGLAPIFAAPEDQYTVFAPNNQAFITLLGDLNAFLGTSVGSLDELIALLETALVPTGGTAEDGEAAAKAFITDILLYHVTEGRRASNSVVPKQNQRVIETFLEGETFAVQTDLDIVDAAPDAVFAGPTIIEPFDLTASNGLIHTVDAVLLPEPIVEAVKEAVAAAA